MKGISKVREPWTVFVAGQRPGGRPKPAKFKQYWGGGVLEGAEGWGDERSAELGSSRA